MRLVGAVDALERFPQLGRVVPDFDNPLVRELIVGDYRIAYEIDGQTIWIASVIHGATDIGARRRGPDDAE
jgi:plasmid stabilization system protein ParE